MSGYVVLVTVGHQAGTRKRPGQLVKATIVFSGGGGEEPIAFGGDGKYLNDLADSRIRRRCWWVAKRSLSPGDSIRIDVFTGVKGAGEDTELTGSWLYALDPSADIQEVKLPNIGPKGYPLLKGRLVELAATTKREQNVDELQQYFDDEAGM